MMIQQIQKIHRQLVVEENSEIQVKEMLRMRVFESQPNSRYTVS